MLLMVSIVSSFRVYKWHMTSTALMQVYLQHTQKKNLSGWIGGLIFHRSIWVCWKGKGKMSKPLRILAAVNTTFARNFLLFLFFLKHKGRRNGNQFFTLLLLRFLTFTEKERKEGELIGWIFTLYTKLPVTDALLATSDMLYNFTLAVLFCYA